MNQEAGQERRRARAETARLVEGAGAGLILIGAYVPWVVTFALFTSVPVRGVETTFGRVVPLIPLAGFALLAWRWYVRRAPWVHVAVAGLGIAAIALVLAYAVEIKRNLVRAERSLAKSGQVLPGSVRVDFDVGLYLTAVGGAAMLVGGILGLASERSTRSRK